MTNELKEAIDTVVSELTKPFPTDREIEAEAFNSISPSIWIKSAKWMRDKMMGDIK